MSAKSPFTIETNHKYYVAYVSLVKVLAMHTISKDAAVLLNLIIMYACVELNAFQRRLNNLCCVGVKRL